MDRTAVVFLALVAGCYSTPSLDDSDSDDSGTDSSIGTSGTADASTSSTATSTSMGGTTGGITATETTDGSTSGGSTSSTTSSTTSGGGSTSSTTTGGTTGTTGPAATCGDNVVDGDDDCDGTDLAGESCVSLGYGAGNLTCTASCTFNIFDCGECGDGNIDVAEQCDGANLGGYDCTDFGYDEGTLGCDAVTCTFDTGLCTQGGGVAGCGDVHVLFATSATYPSTFGSLVAADNICDQIGQNVDAGVAWMAIMSGGTVQAPVDARTRISVTKSVVSTTCSMYAVDEEDLWDGLSTQPVKYDENGFAISQFDPTLNVWTGTDRYGFLDEMGRNCTQWTVANSNVYGRAANVIATDWMGENTSPCSLERRLFCISQ